MDRKSLKQRLDAVNFISNNGRVLRTINILRYQYNELKSVQAVLEEEGIETWEFLDCVNYLTEEGYIRLREITSKNPVQELSQDVKYKTLEAKLTAKGIRLLAGGIKDDLVEV